MTNIFPAAAHSQIWSGGDHSTGGRRDGLHSLPAVAPIVSTLRTLAKDS